MVYVVKPGAGVQASLSNGEPDHSSTAAIRRLPDLSACSAIPPEKQCLPQVREAIDKPSYCQQNMTDNALRQAGVGGLGPIYSDNKQQPSTCNTDMFNTAHPRKWSWKVDGSIKQVQAAALSNNQFPSPCVKTGRIQTWRQHQRQVKKMEEPPPPHYQRWRRLNPDMAEE